MEARRLSSASSPLSLASTEPGSLSLQVEASDEARGSGPGSRCQMLLLSGLLWGLGFRVLGFGV